MKLFVRRYFDANKNKVGSKFSYNYFLGEIRKTPSLMAFKAYARKSLSSLKCFFYDNVSVPYRDKRNSAFVAFKRCREGPLWPRLELTLEKGAMEMLGSEATEGLCQHRGSREAPASQQAPGLAPPPAISRLWLNLKPTQTSEYDIIFWTKSKSKNNNDNNKHIHFSLSFKVVE